MKQNIHKVKCKYSYKPRTTYSATTYWWYNGKCYQLIQKWHYCSLTWILMKSCNKALYQADKTCQMASKNVFYCCENRPHLQTCSWKFSTVDDFTDLKVTFHVQKLHFVFCSYW